jgi:hypothetical protein
MSLLAPWALDVPFSGSSARLKGSLASSLLSCLTFFVSDLSPFRNERKANQPSPLLPFLASIFLVLSFLSKIPFVAGRRSFQRILLPRHLYWT